jgi:glyoxylase-like metal-dependent hydrolase (beta-lactamase superfamily II)
MIIPIKRFRLTVQITEVAESTYLIDCGEIPLLSIRAHEVAYLLVDDLPVLIEPGSTAAASRLLSNSSKLGLRLEDLSYIIPTHVHVDHGGGAGYLAGNLPKAKVVLHPRGAIHMTDTSRLVQGTRLIYGEDFEEAFGPILPVPEDRIHVAKDGEVISLGKRELRIIFSPGHAPHHISILDSLTHGLFCGEALGVTTDSAPDVALPDALPPFDPEVYLESIEKLEKLSPKLLFYSHFGVRRNAATLIKQVKESSIVYSEIIRRSVELGEDDHKIHARLSEYVRGLSPEVELLGVPGYVDYFRNRR